MKWLDSAHNAEKKLSLLKELEDVAKPIMQKLYAGADTGFNCTWWYTWWYTLVVYLVVYLMVY